MMESFVTTAIPGILDDGAYRAVDTTLGYLVTPEATLRLGHAVMKRWNISDVDHQIGLSIVWAKRWW